MGRLEEALADCNEALRLAPNDPANLDSRGFTYLKLGRFEQAIADYDAALAHNPRDPGSLYGRGLARLRVKMILKVAAPTLRRRKCSTPMSPRNLLATDLASEPQGVYRSIFKTARDSTGSTDFKRAACPHCGHGTANAERAGANGVPLATSDDSQNR